MVNMKQMVWEPKKYLVNIFDLCHVSEVAAYFKKKNKVQKKNKTVVYLLKWKNIKKQDCTDIFGTLPYIYDGAFLRKYERLKASS